VHRNLPTFLPLASDASSAQLHTPANFIPGVTASDTHWMVKLEAITIHVKLNMQVLRFLPPSPVSTKIHGIVKYSGYSHQK